VAVKSPDRFLRRLEADLHHGVVTVWILETLYHGPTYGYALLKEWERANRDASRAGPTALYSALARLERFGLVVSFHGTESQGPIRKYYRLTSTGVSTAPLARAVFEMAREPLGRRATRETGAPQPG
jgi:PadR family transcriptional regulator, regulatory protein PadR